MNHHYRFLAKGAVFVTAIVSISFTFVVSAPAPGPPAEVVVSEAYVRQQAPPFEIPKYKGREYTDKIPDTIDLAEMARLAINGLTGPNDPQNGYELYFIANWNHNPPLMYHEFSSACQSKFLGPLVLNRLISGSNESLDVEKRIIELYLRGIDSSGLYHAPVKGRPWRHHGWNNEIWGGSAKIDESKAKEMNASEPPYTGGSINARLIEGMLLHYLRDKNPMWREILEGMIANGTKGLIDNGRWGYFGSPDKVPIGFEAADGWTPQALAQCYKVLGNQRALEVSGKLCYYLRNHSDNFHSDGRFIGDQEFAGPKAQFGGHFHIHANCLLAFIEYATAANDKEMAEFAKKSFEWAKSEDASASTLIGYFPEFVGKEYPNSEGCPVADMVALAIMLSRAGVGDYWDDADRWVRNYFSELQLDPKRAKQLEAFSKTQVSNLIPYNATAENVTARNVGAFAGWPSPNDWMHHIGIQHCCTGNCARAIYYVWKGILEQKGDTLKINMLMNCASKWADVYSMIPYEGAIEIKMKAPFEEVMIRLPEWVDPKEDRIQLSVNGNRRKYDVNGRYLIVNEVSASDKFRITFPIRTTTRKERIGGNDYSLTIKGNTVIAIDPPGRNSPIFARARYAAIRAPSVERERFVADEDITW